MTEFGRVPPPLHPGDVVTIVSPGGHCEPDRVKLGTRILQSWGLEVRVSPSATGRWGYLSAPDDVRLSELQEALDDTAVRAVIATRGGYGADRIVDRLRITKRNDHTFFVGFSDNTSLHLQFLQSGISTLYGPPIAWDEERNGARSASSLRRALMEPWSPGSMIISSRADEPTAALTTVGASGVSGQIVGGNLAMLAASMGTKTAPVLVDRLVFLEDVQEPPFRVDRMMMHLRRAGGLDQAKALMLGQFTRCRGLAGAPTVLDALRLHIADLGIPVLGGLPVGHGENQQTLLLGAVGIIDFAGGALVLG